MPPDAKTFLAATVLNDGRMVSYRSLSRELKVHCNIAKKMLYEFHSVQNAKKQGSIRATYLLDGVPHNVTEQGASGREADGEDVHMQSSPYMSSSMPQQEEENEKISTRKVTLARENVLEAAKATFERLYSIHVYSLGPGSVQNLQSLSDCNREICMKYISEDPLVAGKQYGVIQNSGVRRRTGRRPAAPTQVVDKNEKGSNRSLNSKAATQAPNTSDRPSMNGNSSRASSHTESMPAERKIPSKPAPLKREQSDIFKSFSKPEATLNRGNTGSSAGQSPAPTNVPSDTNSVQEDEPMKDASESEDESDFVETNKVESQAGKSRSEREAQLRKMMDDEDEDIKYTANEPEEASQVSEPIDAPEPQKAASVEPPTASVGGRRRGRRKVMKKKTIKDEEGYLVTREEPAWESFSEDEPAPHQERTPASTASSSVTKGKKPIAKPGQGNIMSFFGKK